jgi:hypothetical protein
MKPKCDLLVSNFAFPKFNLYRYSTAASFQSARHRLALAASVAGWRRAALEQAAMRRKVVRMRAAHGLHRAALVLREWRRHVVLEKSRLAAADVRHGGACTSSI